MTTKSQRDMEALDGKVNVLASEVDSQLRKLANALNETNKQVVFLTEVIKSLIKDRFEANAADNKTNS